MKIEIRLIDDLRNESGRLLEIVETKGESYTHSQTAAVSAMLTHARKIFGSGNYEAVNDTTIFGGYYRAREGGACIVAR